MDIPFDPDEIQRTIEKEALDDAKAAAEAAAQALVFLTPVGMPELWQALPPVGYAPGHARRNWQASLGGQINEEREGSDPSGGSTVAEMRLIIRGAISLRTKINLQLTIPYGRRLNAGHSTQQPAGFVENGVVAAISSLDNSRRRI